MPGKRHSQDEISNKLQRVEALTAQGKSLIDALKLIGVSRQTLYRWRQENAVSQPSPEKRVLELEAENQRLRKALTDLMLEKIAMQEAFKNR